MLGGGVALGLPLELLDHVIVALVTLLVVQVFTL